MDTPWRKTSRQNMATRRPSAPPPPSAKARKVERADLDESNARSGDFPPFIMPADPPSGHTVSSQGVKFTFIGTVSGSFVNITFQFIIVMYMYVCAYAYWLN